MPQQDPVITSIQIAYDGPALAAGTMDVNDLAPALLALGDLLQEANRELNGPTATLSIQVKSDFKTGSFGIDLMLALAHAQSYIADPVATARQIAEYVGLVKTGAVTLIALVKLLHGRKPEVLPGDSNVSLKVAGVGNNVNVNIIKLYGNPQVREALAKTVKPLRSAGINKFEIRDREDRPVETVTDDDLPAFEVPSEVLSLVPPAEMEPKVMFVEVLRAALRPNLRWSVSDGRSKYGVLIRDEAFWKRMESTGLQFVKGLQMKVRMRFVQHQTSEGLKADSEIIEVIEVLPPPSQPRLYG